MLRRRDLRAIGGPELRGGAPTSEHSECVSLPFRRSYGPRLLVATIDGRGTPNVIPLGSAWRLTVTSIQGRLMIASLWLRRNKKFYADPKSMRDHLSVHQDPRRARPPGWLTRRFGVERVDIDGHPTFTITPRSAVPGALHVFHMHGGGFVESPEPHHWRFAARIAERLGCRYTMPMYPLAPQHAHPEITGMVESAYTRVMTTTPPNRRLVFGDSAGGTLALTLTRHLRERGQDQPAAIALFSPWIDLATDDPDSLRIDPVDPELGVIGLRQAGHWYAAGRALYDPDISPAFADIAGSPPISVFIGHRDILLPDARRIAELGQRAGVRVDLHEYRGMFHNWIMKNIPEASDAIEQLLAFVHDATHGTGS